MQTEESNNLVDGIEPDDTTEQNGDGSVDEIVDVVAESTAESTDSESVPPVATPPGVVGQRHHSSARSRRRNRGR